MSVAALPQMDERELEAMMQRHVAAMRIVGSLPRGQRPALLLAVVAPSAQARAELAELERAA